jgi:hypothetical protein
VSRLSAAEWARFVRVWNDEESRATAAARLGLAENTAARRAVTARRRGLPVKYFKKPRARP